MTGQWFVPRDDDEEEIESDENECAECGGTGEDEYGFDCVRCAGEGVVDE